MYSLDCAGALVSLGRGRIGIRLASRMAVMARLPVRRWRRPHATGRVETRQPGRIGSRPSTQYSRLADAANSPREAAAAAAAAATAASAATGTASAAATSAATAAASATTAPSAAAASARELLAQARRSGVLLVEDKECPQAHVGNLFLVEGNLRSDRGVPRYICYRPTGRRRRAARQRQRHSHGTQHHGFLLVALSLRR
jgi:hypothetical protein